MAAPLSPIETAATMHAAVYVINLPKAIERRQRIEAHLAALNLSQVQIFPAVYGADIPANELAAQYEDRRAASRAGRSFTRGEIGCALSHVGVYRQILAQQQPWAMVLEDDALLNPAVPALLPSIARWLQSPEPRVLLCSPLRSFYHRGDRALGSGHRMVRLHRAWNAHGYCLNVAAAAALSRVNHPVVLMADDWMGYQQRTRVEVRGVDPYCIGTNELAQVSQLEADRAKVRAKRPLAFRIRKSLRKLASHVVEYLWLRPVYGIRHHRGGQ